METTRKCASAGHSNKPKAHFPPFWFSFRIQILKKKEKYDVIALPVRIV